MRKTRTASYLATAPPLGSTGAAGEEIGDETRRVAIYLSFFLAISGVSSSSSRRIGIYAIYLTNGWVDS
jgi:hypothetical protein